MIRIPIIKVKDISLVATDLNAESSQQASKISIKQSSDQVELDVKFKNKDMSVDLTSDEITPDIAKDLMSNVSAENAKSQHRCY